MPLQTVRAIEIEQFVPARREQRETVFVKQSYYLEPEPIGRKAFGLLKTVLAEQELQAICKIVLKDREQLAVLDPFGSTMLLSTLYWPDEVRDVGELDLPQAEPEFKPAELAMARQLVEALTGEFDACALPRRVPRGAPRGHRGQGRRPARRGARARPEASKLTDLMAVLEASVAAARKEASAEADGRTRRPGRLPGRSPGAAREGKEARPSAGGRIGAPARGKRTAHPAAEEAPGAGCPGTASQDRLTP